MRPNVKMENKNHEPEGYAIRCGGRVRPTSAERMKKSLAKSPVRIGIAGSQEVTFREIVGLIERARQRAFQAVNTALIDLYWQVGEYISRKLDAAAWGEGVVDELARYLQRHHPDLKGFTRASLFRMRQFYETYRADKKVAPLVRQLSWSHHLLILGRCKRPEEREFYLRLCTRERWGKRELERQLSGALFERSVLAPAKVSVLLTCSMSPANARISGSKRWTWAGCCVR